MEFSDALTELIYRVLEEAGTELKSKDILARMPEVTAKKAVSQRLPWMLDRGYLTHRYSGNWLRSINSVGVEDPPWYALQQGFDRIDAARKEMNRQDVRDNKSEILPVRH